MKLNQLDMSSKSIVSIYQNGLFNAKARFRLFAKILHCISFFLTRSIMSDMSGIERLKKNKK